MLACDIQGSELAELQQIFWPTHPPWGCERSPCVIYVALRADYFRLWAALPHDYTPLMPRKKKQETVCARVQADCDYKYLENI